MFQRTGARLADLTPAQKTAVMSLLSVALSRDGYRKVVDIMRGDEALRNAHGREGSVHLANALVPDEPPKAAYGALKIV